MFRFRIQKNFLGYASFVGGSKWHVRCQDDEKRSAMETRPNKSRLTELAKQMEEIKFANVKRWHKDIGHTLPNRFQCSLSESAFDSLCAKFLGATSVSHGASSTISQS